MYRPFVSAKRIEALRSAFLSVADILLIRAFDALLNFMFKRLKQ